jgi:hypothetical protein
VRGNADRLVVAPVSGKCLSERRSGLCPPTAVKNVTGEVRRLCAGRRAKPRSDRWAADRLLACLYAAQIPQWAPAL